MVALVYGVSAYERKRGDLPELPVINMFAEIAATESTTTLQSRPGLEDSDISMGSGPVRGLFRIDGVLNNGLFGVSGNTLYRGSESLGSINGSSIVSLSGYEDTLFANAGSTIYGYDGSILTPIAFPDSAEVIKIVVGSSRLIAIRKDSGRFYWSDPLSTVIDDLSFATAENAPDKLKDALFVGDTLILFGSETVEFWPASTDPDLPFQPTPGRTYQSGIRDTGCATTIHDTWAWISETNQIFITNPENLISDPGLEVRIKNSQTASLWTFVIDGTDFLCVTLDDETWVYHSLFGTWSQMESYGHDNWLPICFEDGYFGLRNSGTLSEWADNYLDYGGVLERRFRAGMPITGGTEPINNIIIRTNPGQTPFITGLYTNPTISLRSSRDGGFTWGPFKEKRLGTQGSYNIRSMWTSLGYFSYPGALFEFRVTDPVPFRVSGVDANEVYGGI